MGTVKNVTQKIDQLNRELYILYLSYKDPRTPIHARQFAALVVGYAFSPIDLIPDPIPILGYLDDAIVLPLGVILTRKMIPEEVLSESRQKAREMVERGEKRKPGGRRRRGRHLAAPGDTGHLFRGADLRGLAMRSEGSRHGRGG